MHQIVGIDLNNWHFPSANYKEGETHITKGCKTYGEAVSTISIDQNIRQLFELFFKGFANPLWLPYLNNDNLTLPCECSFETGCNDLKSIAILNIFIHPCILPAEFSGGRQNHTFNAHPFFTSWWQEFHDHTFNAPVNSLCLELMPDFQPISEVIYLFSPLSQSCPSLLIMILCHFLQNTVSVPRARTISYNIAGPISTSGFNSTTLAQLMSRYATSDPTLISLASDKSKAPSLVAPSAAKKKRTFKRVLIEVNIFPS
jgi:hypothetical protein